MNKQYTNEELINELHRFYNENGRIPKYNDFKFDKKFPSVSTYEKHFGTWNSALIESGFEINKIWNKLIGDECCTTCGSIHTSSAGWYYKNNKRICNKCYDSDRNYLHGISNPNSNTGISIITEHIVYKILNDCVKCNTKDNFHAKYDLISEKYKTINVKSSKLRKYKNSFRWDFGISKGSKVPDYYVCIGFDECKKNILKIWFIDKNSVLITKNGIYITNSKRGLERVNKYETNIEQYSEIYKNLNIYSLSEFCNINGGDKNK